MFARLLAALLETLRPHFDLSQPWFETLAGLLFGFRLAEVAVTGPMVRAILAGIRRLRAPPLCAGLQSRPKLNKWGRRGLSGASRNGPERPDQAASSTAGPVPQVKRLINRPKLDILNAHHMFLGENYETFFTCICCRLSHGHVRAGAGSATTGCFDNSHRPDDATVLVSKQPGSGCNLSWW